MFKIDLKLGKMLSCQHLGFMVLKYVSYVQKMAEKNRQIEPKIIGF